MVRGPVVQRLERTAHNGVVVGSSPTGPTTQEYNQSHLRKEFINGQLPIYLYHAKCQQNLRRWQTGH